MMRIGINASFARKIDTGIGQVTINFLRKLIEASNIRSQLSNVDVVLYLEEDLPKDIKLPNNWTKCVHLPLYKRDDLIRKIWWEKYWLPGQVKRDKCSIFLSLYQCPTFLPQKIKHIMLVHDVIPKIFPEYLNNWRKKIYWKLTEAAIKDSDKILTVSHHTEKDLIQNLKIDPSKITVNYIDVDNVYKNQSYSSHDLKVLEKYNLHTGYVYCGGGLEIRKNVEGVIRAYNLLYKKNRNIQYVRHFPPLVISGRLMPQLAPLITDAEKLIKELNLTEHVKLLGFVPQEDLPVIYRHAQFFVYPSHYEGFGLPILEAMNSGTPVITSKKSSLPEVGSDAVLYCKPDDIEDIAMVMKNLLVNKFLREKLSERGKERAKYFSWDKFTNKTLNIIHDSRYF